MTSTDGPSGDRRPATGYQRIAVACLAGTLVTMPACRRQAPAENVERESTAVPVAAQRVKAGNLRALIRASGVVVPADGAEFLLVAPETARVIEITKDVGDPVTSGEVLVRFELAGATQDVVRQRAEVARVQAQLESARNAHARTRDFVARGLVPRVDLERADRELSDAQDAMDRANAAFKASETAAARATVIAPLTGIVATRLHNPGDLVQPAATDPILRIVDPRRVEVIASVAVADAARVLPGASARLANPRDGSSLRLSVANRTVFSAASGGTVAFRLLPVEPLTVDVDTTVAIEIDAEERAGVVIVSPEVIARDAGEMVVMVAVGDRAERRPVTTGITTDAGVEITSGLKPGELVITQGNVGLPDGAEISVVVR